MAPTEMSDFAINGGKEKEGNFLQARERKEKEAKSTFAMFGLVGTFVDQKNRLLDG